MTFRLTTLDCRTIINAENFRQKLHTNFGDSEIDFIHSMMHSAIKKI